MARINLQSSKGNTMNHTAAFLIVASAAALLACGKTEEAPAPASPPPTAEAPPAQLVPEPAVPVVETPPSEAPPATQPETPLAQPAAASKPATAAAPAVASTPSPDLARGEQIYRQACAFCHDKGVAGAPKIGDVAAWSPRLAQGMDMLYAVSLRGKGAMPAKGGNPALADADVKAAVDFIVAQSR
jgi:cytochrome c5